MTLQLMIDLNPSDARALTDQIKTGVEVLWELVIRAYDGRADRALGYSSWDDYCTREFGSSRLRLPREERPEVVASLRESGLSVRAIAAATGDSRETIRRELLAGDTNVSPEPLDVDADELAEELIAAELPKITGLDGKSYPTPAAPSQPRRRPIADQANDAGWDIRRSTERVERLLADDRLSQNIQQVRLALRGHLLYVQDAVTTALEKIT